MISTIKEGRCASCNRTEDEHFKSITGLTIVDSPFDQLKIKTEYVLLCPTATFDQAKPKKEKPERKLKAVK